MRLDEIAEMYAEQMDFYCVYIQEVHPDDGWQVQHNIDEGIVYTAPTTIEERADLAEICVLNLNFKMPMLLDNISNEVDLKYNALPERLYVLNKVGAVTFKSVAGSMGFDPEAWAKAIDELLR